MTKFFFGENKFFIFPQHCALPIFTIFHHLGYDYNVLESEKKVCAFYRHRGYCARGQNCHYLHIQTGLGYLDKFGDACKTVTNHCNSFDEKEEVESILINSIRHPDSFFVTILPDENDDHNASYGLRTADEDLSRLTLEMTKHYENDERRWNKNFCDLNADNFPYVAGEMVAVLHEEQWKRGRIIELFESGVDGFDFDLPGDKVRIFLVDSGCYIDVTLDAIRRILNDFLKLPWQAIECSLFGVDYPDGEKTWTLESCQKFLELTSNSPLRAKVISDDSLNPEIEIFAKIDDVWVDVAQELIKQGLASPRNYFQQSKKGNEGSPIVIPG